MEDELAHLGGGGGGSTSSAPPPLGAAAYGRNYCPATTAATSALAYLQYPTSQPLPPSPISEGELKVRIMSHPQYPALVTAYIDCQKVGAPPDVAARLSAVAGELDESRSSCLPATSSDPELDQFMEAYCDMLVKYREEITRILDDAMGFLKRAESQFNAIADTASSMRLFISSEENYEGVASSEDDQDASCGGTDLPENDRHSENDKELKLQLLKKYSGYLSSLRQQLSKKKSKGKLPKEARHKLLSWWELHYRWPYPSSSKLINIMDIDMTTKQETEKAALAESTGLDQKQINNWFINQRKRHWKPSEEMQFVMMEGFHPQSLSSLCMEGQFSCDSSYRPGP